MPIIDIPLLGAPDERYALLNIAVPTDRDAKLINCYPELLHSRLGTTPEKYAIRSRPGTVLLDPDDDNIPTFTSTIRGMHAIQNVRIFVAGDSIYLNDSAIYTDVDSGTIAFATINEYADSSGNHSFIVSNGVNLYLVVTDLASSHTITAITPASTNLPDSHVKGVVYMDGFVFVMDNQGTIYNSNFNDPTTFGALDFINADMEADGGTVLAKYNNYVVAFGSRSYQFFYNAGNPVGSVLSPAQGMSGQVGCPIPNTLAVMGPSLAWVGVSRDGARGVFAFDGHEPRQVAPPWMLRQLRGVNFAATVIMDNRLFFTITTINQSTWAYDFDSDVWISLEFSVDVDFAVVHTASLVDSAGATTPRFFFNIGQSVYTFNETSETSSDATEDVNVTVVTNPIDFGTGAIKHMDSLELDSDRISDSSITGGSSSTVTIQVTYSDNDWISDITNPDPVRTINLKQRDVLTRLGVFTNRAFKFIYSGPVRIRLRSIRVGIRSSQRLVAGIK
jgi:hypothetical protein